MLASGESTGAAGAACAEALCSRWPGPCAKQRGVETTDQEARDFCSQDSLSSLIAYSDIQGSLVFVTTACQGSPEEAAPSWERPGQVRSLPTGLRGLQVPLHWLAHLSCSPVMVAA